MFAVIHRRRDAMSAGSTSKRGSSRDCEPSDSSPGPPRRPRGHPNPVCFLLGLDGRPEDRFRQQRRLGRDLKVKLESPVRLP
jgi:hypothetical protein